MLRMPLRPTFGAMLLLMAAACADQPVSPPAARHEVLISDETDGTLSPAGRYVVVFQSSVTDPAATASQMVANVGGQLVYTYSSALAGFAADLPAGGSSQLESDPRVAYVELDAFVNEAGSTIPAPTWGLDRVDQRSLPLDGTYSDDKTGVGVTVYVIDSEIDISSPEFGGRASNGTDVIGGPTVGCIGHGSFVAAIIGGTTYGVAKGAHMVGVRVFPCFQAGGQVADVLAGIDWVAAHHAAPSVANLSLITNAQPSQALEAGVDGLIASGVTVVAAAGNFGADACNYSPSRMPGVITVGATGSNDYFASGLSNQGSCVDLLAPGVGITSLNSNGGTQSVSGTSASAGYVSGAAAIVLETSPAATPAQVRNELLERASHLPAANVPSGTTNLLVYTLPPRRRAVHRLYNANNQDHMYTIVPNEAAQLGYVTEVMNYFYVAAGEDPGTVPLYRCYMAYTGASIGDHFLSTSNNCEGQTYESRVGWIAPTQFPGTIPLYRLWSASYSDHIYTTSASEVHDVTTYDSYVSEGIIGYVYTH